MVSNPVGAARIRRSTHPAMAHTKDGAWREWRNSWSWEEWAHKLESATDEMKNKYDELRRVLDDQHHAMTFLETEVARLGQENQDLRQRVVEVEGGHTRQRVVEVEGGHTSHLDRIHKRPRREWKHPELKADEISLFRGGPGPCQNCHGGILPSPDQEEKLQELWNDWPLKMDPWISSLDSTLFFDGGTGTWPDMQKALTRHAGHFCVWGNTKNRNARKYFCRCSLCGRFATAPYGAWESEEEHQKARDELATFVLGRKAEDSRRS